MKIAVPKELRDSETRVAMSPDMIKRLVGMGLEVMIETGAGIRAMLPDAQYQMAGAAIGTDANETYSDADIVFKVRRPMGADEGLDELAMMKRGTVLIGLLEPFSNKNIAAILIVSFTAKPDFPRLVFF